MRTHGYIGLKEVQINPLGKGKTGFVFRLLFRGAERLDAVEFEISSRDLMRLMCGLQALQAHHKLAIPPTARRRGKPILHVVTDDE